MPTEGFLAAVPWSGPGRPRGPPRARWGAVEGDLWLLPRSGIATRGTFPSAGKVEYPCPEDRRGLSAEAARWAGESSGPGQDGGILGRGNILCRLPSL